MKVIDSEKVISVMEEIKQYLPDIAAVTLPEKIFNRTCMDKVIQRIRAESIELDISEVGERPL